jgi:MerR family mercuric resistance operon transcriptional regulator
MERLKTGELAKRAGVNVETLRFYERKGLLPEPPRRESGYREYPAESVRRIRFIKRAQELGFSLGEIREILALRVQPGTTCADVRDRAEHKILDVREKIADLKAIERALQKLTTTCTGSGPLSECPILENLDGELSSGPDRSGSRQLERGDLWPTRT